MIAAASAPAWLGHRRAAWLVAALFTGCATPPPGTEPPVFSGRLALQVAAQPPDAAERAVSAHFDLSGNASRGHLELSTPLGTGLGAARWVPGEVVLASPGGQRERFDDLDALTRGLLGEALPVAALFDWLAGRPWPGAPSQPLAAPGFTQLGWRIDLARAHAGLIVARRDAPPAVTLRVQLDGPPQEPRP